MGEDCPSTADSQRKNTIYLEEDLTKWDGFKKLMFVSRRSYAHCARANPNGESERTVDSLHF